MFPARERRPTIRHGTDPGGRPRGAGTMGLAATDPGPPCRRPVVPPVMERRAAIPGRTCRCGWHVRGRSLLNLRGLRWWRGPTAGWRAQILASPGPSFRAALTAEADPTAEQGRAHDQVPGPPGPMQRQRNDACWRAADDLPVGQICLLAGRRCPDVHHRGLRGHEDPHEDQIRAVPGVTTSPEKQTRRRRTRGRQH